MEKLERLLIQYNNNGLPDLPPEIMGTRFRTSDEKTDKMLSLERTWRDIVQFSQDLSKSDRIIHEALWEIFTTGLDFLLDHYRKRQLSA